MHNVKEIAEEMMNANPVFISYRYVDLDTEGGRSLDPWLFMVINFPSGQGPHVQLPTALLGQLRKWKLMD